MRRRTDTGQHQELRRVECASSKYHLASADLLDAGQYEVQRRSEWIGAIEVLPLGKFDATSFGPSCYGRGYIGPASEDCLTLNIWRPAGITGEDSVPVFVWLH